MQPTDETRAKYRLISLGKLKQGVSTAQALPALQALTRLDEMTVRRKLLSGKKASLLTTSDVTRLATLKGKFAAAGLMVEVMEVPVAATAADSGSESRKKRSAGTRLKRVAFGLAAVLLLLAGMVGGLWYWLFQPMDDPTVAVETALVDDHTAALAHANLKQAGRLSQLFRVPLADLASGPNGDTPSLVSILTASGLSVHHLFAAVRTVPGADAIDVLAVATGQFTAEQLRAAVTPHFNVDTAENGRWLLSARSDRSGIRCPGDVALPSRQVWVEAGTNRLVIASSAAGIDRFNLQLHAGGSGSKLGQWQQYRAGKLASAMVFSPRQGTEALPGFAGMIGSQIVASVPNVTSAAVSAEIDVMARGVRINGQIGSNDSNWNSQTATQANKWLTGTRTDSRLTSPAAAQLLDSINIKHDTQTVQADWSITATMLTQLRRSVENTLASALGGRTGKGGDGEIRINDQPVNYQYPFRIADLPVWDNRDSVTAPLYRDGSMVVDFNRLTMSDQGLLELTLDAKTALPEDSDSNALQALLTQQFQITAVTDAEGQSLLSDDRCADRSGQFGTPNHEPSTQGSVFLEQASISKRVHLKEGVTVEDIQAIDARYELSQAVQIKIVTLPLRAGEQIQHGGVTFDLISVGDRSVRYRLTGDPRHLLAVRARNAEGQVLRNNWRSGFGRLNDQHFYGPVAQLEVIMAGAFETRTVNASISNLFQPDPDNEQPATPFALSYAPVERAKWNRYQFVDMRLVRSEPDDWRTFNNDAERVGQISWPGVKMLVSHSESGWSGNPGAHLYLPQMKELLGSMSALSYRLTGEEDPIDHYVPLAFRYNPDDLTLVPQQVVQNQPFGLTHFALDTGQESGTPFAGVEGRIALRLPQRMTSHALALHDLWTGQSIDGIQVTLEAVNRGRFPGYQLRLDGELQNLIAVHGLDKYGNRVIPISRNFQSGGYWTATIPFRDNLSTVQLVTAQEQDVFELPFRF